MKYFHELTDEEYNALVESGITYGELAIKHPQPIWCTYPDALQGPMGCWALVHRKMKVSEDSCKTCECCVLK